MLHHAINAVLVYLFVGSCAWIVLDAFGFVEKVFLARAARGASTSVVAWSLASFAMILVWPRFVWAFAMRGRGRA